MVRETVICAVEPSIVLATRSVTVEDRMRSDQFLDNVPVPFYTGARFLIESGCLMRIFLPTWKMLI